MTKKPTIVLCGTMPKQARRVQAQCPGIHVVAMNREDVVAGKRPRCDRIVVLTRFVKHKHEDVVKKSYGKRLVRMPGGMTRLVERVRGLAQEVREEWKGEG